MTCNALGALLAEEFNEQAFVWFGYPGGRDVDGHPERRGEHLEGMLSPNAPRNKGAKYRLWKPYETRECT